MIPSKNFAQFTADLTLAWQNAIGIVPALQEGDILYAIFQALSAQLLFLQAQVQIVNAIARAQTSTGADLDSFMAQFNFPRLQASFLLGPETFNRYSASATQVLVSPGVLVQTPGGAVQYEVVPDTTQAAWNPAFDAYVMNPGATSITCTVQALVAGTSYSVTAGQLSQIATALPGIDFVTNPDPISSATPVETDTAYRARFVQYLAALSKATRAAILYAIQSIQPGLFTNLLENENSSGGSQLGAFTAVVDDGTGTPPSSLIAQAFAAVDAARGFTIQPYVVAPTVIVPTISITIRVDPAFIAAGGTNNEAKANVNAAIVAAVNVIEPAQTTLFISEVEAAALTAAGCQAVQPGTTIDSTNADLVMTEFQAPRIATTNVSVGTY